MRLHRSKPLSTLASLRRASPTPYPTPNAGSRIDASVVKTGFDQSTCRSNFKVRNMVESGDISRARKLFDEMPNRNTISTNMMMSGYLKAGDLLSARRLFDDTVHRSAVTWTILIGGYLQYSKVCEAFQLFAGMHKEGAEPDYVTFATLLKGFNDSDAEQQLIQVHALIIKLSFDSVQIVGNSLVDSYCKTGHLTLARQMFEQMPVRDSVSFNALITGYSNQGLFDEAINLFVKMQSSGFEPSEFTFAAVLSAGSGLGEQSFGQQIHCLVIKSNFLWNVFLGNALLDFYSKQDDMEVMKKLFDEMPEKDGVSFNIMITGYAWDGQVRAALDYFKLLQSSQSDRRQFPFASLLRLAANADDLEMGRQIHLQGIMTTADSEPLVRNALVGMYAKCGRFKEAEAIFAKLSHIKSLVPCTSMISGYVQKGFNEEALKLFIEMNRDNISPDQVTFASVLKACAALGSISLGKQLHSFIIQSGFMSNVFSGSALVDVYAKCGSVKDAVRTFEEMPERNIISWNAMITAYAQNGDGEATIRTFNAMARSGYQPNSVSFLNLFSACSHSGFVDEGLEYLDLMKKEYKDIVKKEHYTSVVDLLCRGGRFDEAEKLMTEMPFAPDEIMWVSVLNSCRIHKNLELATKAAEALFKMEELRDVASYVNMSNIYAAAGQWDNVVKVKKAMRDRGIKKVVGCSWVEVKHKNHVFVANDLMHPQMAQIREKLDSLGKDMEKEGYKPDADVALRNVDEEIKIESLQNHSERLAIAYALINTPEEFPIVVMKNLRTCTDCHAAIKVISKIVGREITVRDRSRFHHFRHGVCSCGDYW